MNFLDVRTVMFSHVVTDAVCTAVLAFLWIQNRKRFAGTSYWVLDFACQTAAVLLIVLRGSIPDWVSIGVPNTLVVAGALFGYMGLALFVGKKSLQIHNYVLLAAFIAVHLYFVFAQPNLAARNLNVSLGLLVMCFQCVWLVLRRVEHGMRRMTLWVGLVFGVFCMVSIVRIVVVLVRPPASNDFFRSGVYDTLLLMSYQFLLILLTFALALMINQRLLREIQTQEEKFTKAFRSSPYAITLTRPSDGQMIDVNDGFVTITGYSYAEAVGKTTFDLQLWAREMDRAAVVSELSRGNRVVGREYQFRKKSGELITGLFSAEIVQINDQPWILSSISDITERKRVAESQAQERALLMTVIDNLPDLIYLKDRESRFVLGNNAIAEFMGAGDSKNLAGKTDRDFFPMDMAEKFLADERRVVETAKGIVNVEEPARTASGSLKWLLTTKVPILDKEGSVTGIVGIGRDITERKRVEDQLRESEEKYKVLFEGSTHGIFATDTETGRVVFANPSMCKMLGYSEAELLQLSVVDIHPKDELSRVKSGIESQGKKGQSMLSEILCLRKDGTIFFADIGGAITFVNGRRCAVGFFADVTERKRAEEERRSLELQVQHSQKLESLGVLAGGIAHDFNNLLMIILGNTDIALQRLSPVSPARPHLEAIEKASHRAASLTNQMLAYSGKEAFQAKKIDLGETIGEMGHLLEAAISKKVHLEMIFAHGLPPIEADVAQMQQVVMNLTINASEAIGENTVGEVVAETGVRECDDEHLRLSRLPEKCPPGRYVFLRVKDSGSGMEDETKAKLFEPFYSTKFAGRGLGLAAVLGIVRGHRGAIIVESEAGKGSTFTVLFPALEGKREKAESGEGLGEEAAWKGTGGGGRL